MQREPNDSERDYDTDNQQDYESFFAVEPESERPAAETGIGRGTGKPSRAKAEAESGRGSRTRSQSAERATGKSANKRSGQHPGGTTRGKRPARRTRPRAAR